MSNIAKCTDRQCLRRKQCWRYMAPSGSHQSYADFGRQPGAKDCESFWSAEKQMGRLSIAKAYANEHP